jgi:hypothetical protein
MNRTLCIPLTFSVSGFPGDKNVVPVRVSVGSLWQAFSFVFLTEVFVLAAIPQASFIDIYATYVEKVRDPHFNGKNYR